MKQKQTVKYVSEHPWDNDEKLSIFRGVTPLFVSFLIIFLALSVSAQRFVIPPTPVEEQEEKEKLSRMQLETAEDYKDILEDLNYHVTDFIDIFSNSNKLESIQMRNELLKMLTKLQTDSYETDVSLLQGDLVQLIDKLRKSEASLRSDTDNKLLYKNFKILRLQLQSIHDIIEEDIAAKLADQAKDQRLIIAKVQKERAEEKAMEENFVRLLEMTERIKDEAIRIKAGSLNITINTEYLKELEESIALQEEFAEKYEDYISSIIPEIVIFKEDDSEHVVVAPLSEHGNLHELPDPPDVPDVPDVPKPQKWYIGIGSSTDDNKSNTYTYNYSYNSSTNSSKNMNSKTLVDSVFISSKNLPINIRNKIGDLKVEGWDKNKILVKYHVGVNGKSKDAVESFLNDIEIELVSKRSGVYISVLYPDIKDASRQIVGSTFELFVPHKNKIFCENSFGNTMISNMKNDVDIALKNSVAVIKNIDGKVEGSTKLGTVNYFDIDGSIHIVADKSSTSVHNCRAKTYIENSFAPVVFKGNIGDAHIRNSSDVTVLNHTGNVDIENKNGTITIQNLTGNLELINSYKPSFIQNVDGSITVENTNSLITLDEISGKSSAVNKSGTIRARGINGPIFFSNPGGTTEVEFDGTLQGNSVIQSDYGTINLFLSNNANINVSAMTDGGSIQNSFTKIDKEDFMSKTSVSLGKSFDTLDIKGTNSIIVISDK